MNIFLYGIILAASAAGFGIARYIRSHTQRRMPIACPLNTDCSRVVRSRYAIFLGIPVELAGVGYYAVTFAFYGFLLLVPFLIPPGIQAVFLLLGGSAFLFSIYLTFVQLATLKEFCSWCLMSAALTAMIAYSAAVVAPSNLITALLDATPILLVLNIFSMSLGLGGSTITDLLLFQFMKDRKISRKESEVLDLVFDVIWISLGVAIITGIGLYLPHATILNRDPVFILKAVAVAVLGLNALLLNLIIYPNIPRHIEERAVTSEVISMRTRRVALAFGGISLVSWYTIALTSALPDLPFGLPFLLGFYAIVLAIGIFISMGMANQEDA